MNRMLVNFPVANEYSLNRDPTRWGVVVSGPPGNTSQPKPSKMYLVYALRPPWVTNDRVYISRWLRTNKATGEADHGEAGHAEASAPSGALKGRLNNGCPGIRAANATDVAASPSSQTVKIAAARRDAAEKRAAAIKLSVQKLRNEMGARLLQATCIADGSHT